MDKPDYTDWEIVGEYTPENEDYSDWEVVGEYNANDQGKYKQFFDKFKDMGKFEAGATGLKRGVENTTLGTLQLLNSLYESVAGKNNAPNSYRNALANLQKQGQEEYAQASAQHPKSAVAGKIAGNIGSTLPAFLAGGPVISKALPYLGRFGAGALGAAAESGLAAFPQYVEEGENRLLNTAEHGGYGALGHGLFTGAGNLGKYLKNKIFPGAEHVAEKYGKNLPVEDILANQRAAAGSETPLGDILGSPQLKQQFENKIAKAPNSGVDEIYSGIDQHIKQKADDLLENISPEAVRNDTNDLVKTLIDKAFHKQRNIKNNLYNKASEIASVENFAPELSSFNKLAKETAKYVEDSPLLGTDPAFRSLYNKVIGLEKSSTPGGLLLNAKGMPINVPGSKAPSLTEVNMVANKLYDEGQRLLRMHGASDRHIGNLYLKLSSAAKDDLKNEIAAKGSPELKKAVEEATKNFKENYSSFLDKDVYKLLYQDKDPQSIVREIIKPGKLNDKYSRIDKIQKMLPENQQNLLGATYLRSAIDKDGNLVPREINKLLNNLGPRQFEALFPDKTVQEMFKDYQRLYKLNSEAVSRMANPKTGARLNENTLAIKNALNNIMGVVTTGLGGIPAGIGSAGLIALAPVRNKALANRLTNETFRNEVVENIINPKKVNTEAILPKIRNRSLSAILTDNEKKG